MVHQLGDHANQWGNTWMEWSPKLQGNKHPSTQILIMREKTMNVEIRCNNQRSRCKPRQSSRGVYRM